MTARYDLFAFSALIASFLWFPAHAHAAVEENYDPGKPRATTPWYGRVGEAQRAADLRFIEGMRPHHAGALTMSQEYLDDADAENALLKQLARGIIRNQTFEILMLDTVEGHMKPPVITEGHETAPMRQIATRGLAQKQGFIRSPMPGPMDGWGKSRAVSRQDVQFAKAMIIHHQAALDMAHDYLNDPSADNGYLRLLCLDILVDQSREIAFMQDIVNAYPGDADAVVITPDMIHGMEGMSHGGAPKTMPAHDKGKDEGHRGHGAHHH